MRQNNIAQIARFTRKHLFGVSGVTDEIRAQWDAAIAKFQATRAALDDAESALWDVEEFTRGDQQDADDWLSELEKVQTAKQRMDAVAGLVQSAANAWASFKSSVGLSGRRGLGLLPALPISLAVIGGLISLALVAITSAGAFALYMRSKNSRLQQYLDAGVPVAEAAAQARADAKSESGFGITSDLSNIVTWVGVGLLAFFIVPKLK